MNDICESRNPFYSAQFPDPVYSKPVLLIYHTVYMMVVKEYLRVDGESIVGKDNKPVFLHGAGLGGWMKYGFPISRVVYLG